ncbi:MAG: 1,4-dihydroxy-2-naphthoate polyprenyltransferase [Planctomycetes bacterium]|nr:1,4-dihydroxy-2-naphthoate polyprenyltransferase [Planctomycetota bacterium]
MSESRVQSRRQGFKRPSASAAIWLQSARPKTLPAAIAPVVIGTCMAYADGAWNVPVTLAILCAAVLIQVGTNFANDYFDFIKGTDRADRVGPTRATAAGLVRPAQMRNATVLIFGLAAVMGLYLTWIGGWPIAVIGVASMASGVLYTAGPFALGYLGLGELFVLIFFGPVAVGGTFYLLTRVLTTTVLISGLAPGFLSCAVLVVNNYRDRHTDHVTGKKTLVVRFGRLFGRIEYAVTLLGGCLIPAVLVWMSPARAWSLMALLTGVPGLFLVQRLCTEPDPKTMNQMLAQTGQLLVLYSLLFSVGWLL